MVSYPVCYFQLIFFSPNVRFFNVTCIDISSSTLFCIPKCNHPTIYRTISLLSYYLSFFLEQLCKNSLVYTKNSLDYRESSPSTLVAIAKLPSKVIVAIYMSTRMPTFIYFKSFEFSFQWSTYSSFVSIFLLNCFFFII